MRAARTFLTTPAVQATEKMDQLYRVYSKQRNFLCEDVTERVFENNGESVLADVVFLSVPALQMASHLQQGAAPAASQVREAEIASLTRRSVAAQRMRGVAARMRQVDETQPAVADCLKVLAKAGM